MTDGGGIKVFIFNSITFNSVFMNQRPNSEYSVTKSSIYNLPYVTDDMMNLIVIKMRVGRNNLYKLRHNPGRILRNALTPFIPPVLTCY